MEEQEEVAAATTAVARPRLAVILFGESLHSGSSQPALSNAVKMIVPACFQLGVAQRELLFASQRAAMRSQNRFFFEPLQRVFEIDTFVVTTDCGNESWSSELVAFYGSHVQFVPNSMSRHDKAAAGARLFLDTNRHADYVFLSRLDLHWHGPNAGILGAGSGMPIDHKEKVRRKYEKVQGWQRHTDRP